MDRMIGRPAIDQYQFQTYEEIREYLRAFLATFNFTQRLKTLKGLTPYQFSCKLMKTEPEKYFETSPLSAGSAILRHANGLCTIKDANRVASKSAQLR
jgi:hypothetical protein